MLVLAQAGHESPELTPYSVAVSSLVALLALVLAFLALRASSKRGNPALRLVGLAFFVFFLKNVFSAFNVLTHVVPHDAIELVLSLFDLGLLLLLFAPLLLRPRRDASSVPPAPRGRS
jgi:ABC-type Co2+ transport system permease subunit